MFHTPGSTQGNTQVYSPFGTYVVEQHEHDAGCSKRYIDDLPHPDLKLEKDLPLAQPIVRAA